eukprot:maker-scaffold429_size173697-snap-gene-0.25 protein:Tk09736 transcript:maker-scaffold429_size173697-snap-gene-0.25-mRNA-1 annotation:"hypothetical protein H097_05211"
MINSFKSGEFTFGLPDAPSALAVMSNVKPPDPPRIKAHYDNHAKDLPPLSEGTKVALIVIISFVSTMEGHSGETIISIDWTKLSNLLGMKPVIQSHPN